MAELSPELAAYIPRFIQIESGGNPNAKTGSYSGILQMGPDEIAKYGGNGLEQGTALLADRAAQLAKTLGRDPTPTELYLAHQQGIGGAQAHMSNPDAPAWENMYGTAEGQRRGEGWAKKAIWGNVPDDIKAQFPGGVDSLTSRQFMDIWRSKVERTPLNAPPISGPQQPPTLEPQKPLPPQPLNLAQFQQPPLGAPQQRAYPVPPYKSGPIDNMVVPPYGLPPDRNTIDPNSMPAPGSPRMEQASNQMQMLQPLNAPQQINRMKVMQALSRVPLPQGFRGYPIG